MRVAGVDARGVFMLAFAPRSEPFRGAKRLLSVKTTETNFHGARAAPNCMKIKSAFLHECRK